MSNEEYKNAYPLLKIKCKNDDCLDYEIELDGKPIPYLRGLTFKMHVDQEVNIVQLEILAKVEIESPVEVCDVEEMFTVVEGKRYKLIEV